LAVTASGRNLDYHEILRNSQTLADRRVMLTNRKKTIF
jgi:hypothetical protein